MARQFPRFILSTPKGGKNKGPFVFHTIYPSLLCRIVPSSEDKHALKNYYKNISGWTIELLHVYDQQATPYEISDAMDDLLKWVPSQF